MRAAIYARTACVPQRPNLAIGVQLEALRADAARRGISIIAEFTDEGLSGLRRDRPGLDRMRDLAERRAFDVLLTCDPERLARDSGLQVLILEELERFGVKAIFLDG
jgi:site-specific DNA recombinase